MHTCPRLYLLTAALLAAGGADAVTFNNGSTGRYYFSLLDAAKRIDFVLTLSGRTFSGEAVRR